MKLTDLLNEQQDKILKVLRKHYLGKTFTIGGTSITIRKITLSADDYLIFYRPRFQASPERVMVNYVIDHVFGQMHRYFGIEQTSLHFIQYIK